MLKLVKWEVVKLLYQKKTWVGIVILAILGCLIGYSLSSGMEGVEMPEIHPLLFPITVISSNLGLFIPIFAVLAIAEMFAGEYVTGTLKNLLVRPLGRTRVYSSKLIAAYIYILFFIVISALIGLGAGYLFLDSDLPFNLVIGMDVVEFSSVAQILGWTAIYMVISSVLVFSFAGLVSLFSCLLDSPAAVIMGSIGYLAGVNILSQVGFKFGKYLLNGEHFSMAARLMHEPVWSEHATPLIVVAGFLLASLTAGWYSFRKKQIVL